MKGMNLLAESGTVCAGRTPAQKRKLSQTLMALVLTAAVTVPASLTLGQTAGKSKTVDGLAVNPNSVRGDEITEAQKDAVEKGMAWLAAHQGVDGSYSKQQSASGITGLAGLVFMSAGNLPGRGKYGDNVSKCLKFVLESQQESGLLSADQTHGPMYGHGFATVFLGEIYGMTGDENVKEALQKAVKLIERTQSEQGGWRYQPTPYDADISVTICEIMGLRAARDAGIKVEKDVIDKAVGYVKKCENPDGGFSYVAGQGSGSGFPRSAAGVAALYYAGRFQQDGPDIKKGLDYLKQFQAGKGNEQGMEGHYYYGNYYAVQAMFLAGGDYWAKWYPAIRDQLIKRRTGDHWNGDVNEDYATSLALIILQMPNRYLPVFNGKGPGS